MNTIIEKLKAEIERLKEENNNIRCDSNGTYCQGYGDAFVDLLLFLSTLEKEEKPIEGLEEETERFIETFGWGKTKHLAEKELISATARHFYELGCRSTAEKYDEIEYKRQRADVCEGFDGITPEEKMNHPLYLEGFEVGRKVGLVLAEKATIPAIHF